jgi:hypothetical protein
MRRRAERCASIIGAKQKRHEPSASHAPVTDVALSPSPHSATTAPRRARARGRAGDKRRRDFRGDGRCEQRRARARAVLVSLVDRGFPPMRAAGARGKLRAWSRTARARMKRLKKPLTEPERAERKREWGDD